MSTIFLDFCVRDVAFFLEHAGNRLIFEAGIVTVRFRTGQTVMDRSAYLRWGRHTHIDVFLVRLETKITLLF